MLCELLPVGIPSLAVCLQALLHGMVPCSSQETKCQDPQLPPPPGWTVVLTAWVFKPKPKTEARKVGGRAPQAE